MNSHPVRLLAAALAVFFFAGPAPRAEERSMSAEKYTWSLADLYPSPAAWKSAKDAVAQRIPQLSRFEGHLGASAPRLHEALSAIMDLDRDLSRLLVYAVQNLDQDTRVAESLEMLQTAETLAVQYRKAASFVRPEILALDPARVRGFVDAEPKLAPYRHYIEDILRSKPHTLSAPEERIAAAAGDIAGTGDSVRGVFANAELPYPEVVLSSGEKVRVDAPAYTMHRASPLREDRDRVFRAFFGAFRDYRRTLGALLYSQVKAHIFYKDTHNFGSSLEAALFDENIPTAVYKQLIDDVNDSLPTLHRYLRLRQKLLGVDQLRYEDLYAPIVKGVNLTFTPEQATEITLAAVAPLGSQYVADLRSGFESRWIDWLPRPGKRSGAYSQKTYDVHPYQLQNFTGLYDELSTVAHETGHSMHSLLADRTQPYVTHDYSIFVAEVASTLNENLLFHHMLDQARDDATRLSILGARLELLRGTLFRQTMFAEFELAIHEMAERGESLTGDNLSDKYLELVRKYYGHGAGVCLVDDLYAVEWAYIPHFFWNFYVYQYATSITASTLIAERIREESLAKPPVTRTRDAYLKMLAAGGSKYPVDILKDAGVDTTTSAPFQAAMKDMNRVMDEMERILAQSPGAAAR